MIKSALIVVYIAAVLLASAFARATDSVGPLLVTEQDSLVFKKQMEVGKMLRFPFATGTGFAPLK